jgi:hypothetical protein
MRVRPPHLSQWFVLIALRSLFVLLTAGGSLAAAGLPQEVYVWPRAWTEPVRRAVVEHGEAFARIIALKAEVTWQGSTPRVVQIPVDYPSLVHTKRPIGFALRIGTYPGPFNRDDFAITYVADLAVKLLAEARQAGLGLSELQLDFDCASSKLDGYRVWVDVIRARIAPVPVVITALPTWLDQTAFKPLAQVSDGYVLQVHSLERPKAFDAAFSLCDPAAARGAVAKAAKIGVPFRVALPTYGYVTAFNGKGRFIGLSAEGPAKSWPSDARFKEVRSDPLQLGPLVREWWTNPPPALKAILWYRLPVQSDTLNWRWPTLVAMLQARIPRKSVRVESHRVESGLSEIGLVNDGELDISSRLAIRARWNGARFVAGDGLQGCEMVERAVSSASFAIGIQPYRLSAGERQVIGWLRLSEDREVQVDIEDREGH